MATIVKLRDGSLQLQGCGDVISDDVVARSKVLAQLSQHARKGAVKSLPVKAELVLSWLSVALAEDKRVHDLSAKQLATAIVVRTPDLQGVCFNRSQCRPPRQHCHVYSAR